jgi:hypothetical protein
MSPALVIAAVLLVGIGFAHSYLGERYILIRLFRRSDLPKLRGSDDFTRKTLRFAWHITTIAWLGFAALLLAPGLVHSGALPLPMLGAVIAATFFASSLLSLVGSRGRHYSWLVFLAVGLLAWFGTR